MNINDLTVGQAKELASIFGSKSSSECINFAIGKYVIIRTYSAGCWAGILDKKSGNEVILNEARRMYSWHAKEGISLSAVALYGVKAESKIVESVSQVWLEAIEIIPCSDVSIKSIKEAKHVKAQ